MPRHSYRNLLLGVLLISFSAVFVKWAGVDPTVSAFYRTLYSAMILLVFACLQPKREFQRNNFKWLWPSLGAAVFLALDLIVWHRLIFKVGAGIATLLGNSQVIFMALWAAWFFHEKISRWLVLFIPIIFIGLYWSLPTETVAGMAWEALAMGLVVGITYAGFLLGLHYAKSKTGQGYPEILSLAIIMLGTAVLVGSYAAGVEGKTLVIVSGRAQLLMFLMALLPQSLGWLFIKTNMTKIPAHQGSLLLLLQPMATVFWGKIFFKETLSWTQGVGVAMALAALAIYQWKFAPTQEMDLG